MNEWMNECMDGRMDGWTDGRMDGWTDGRTDGRMYGHTYGGMDGSTYGRTDGRTYGQTDGRIDGRTDKLNIHMWWDEKASAPLGPMPKKAFQNSYLKKLLYNAKKNSHFSFCCCCDPGPLQYWPLNRSKIQLEKTTQNQLEIGPIISAKMAPKLDQKDPKFATKFAPKLALNLHKICMNTYFCVKICNHGCMARGGDGLPKVSPRPAMPYPCTPSGGPSLKPRTTGLGVALPQGGHPSVNLYPF
jgi:hypothetical protein